MNALELCLAELPDDEDEVEAVDPAEVERDRIAKLMCNRMAVRLLLWAHTNGLQDHWTAVALREAMMRHELLGDQIADFYFELPDAVEAGYGNWTSRDALRRKVAA